MEAIWKKRGRDPAEKVWDLRNKAGKVLAVVRADAAGNYHWTVYEPVTGLSTRTKEGAQALVESLLPHVRVAG